MNHEDNNRASTKGFTLIELLLAMTFISALLLTIALTIVQIANTYNHGMILKEVNQTARAVTQELDRAVRASSSFSADPADYQYVKSTWGGRLCLGQYSYVWNYGKAISETNANRNMYSAAGAAGTNTVKDASGTVRSEIGLVKVLDPAGSYCIPDGTGRYGAVDPTNAVEMLRSGDHGLSIHAFSVTSDASAKDSLSAQALYKFSFTIGTSKILALNEDQSQCKPPNAQDADPNYCAVQQFTIVLRAVSGVN